MTEQSVSFSSDRTNESLSNNLALLMKHNNVSESELARALGVPYNTIHRLISGHTSDPRISTLKSIAAYFNVSLDTLLNPIELIKNPFTTNNYPKAVPIISWEQVSNNKPLSLGNYQNWANWLPIPLASIDNLSQNAYAIESRPSMYPRFPTGSFFVIDPECKPIDGDLILFKIRKDGAVSLRELMIDPPTMKLLPIIQNSDSLNFVASEHEIIGVVVLSMHQPRRINCTRL
ncbi:peptidase, S24 family [Legionella birminghamensis]|uniref:Peptidase, S24 family n=1 Tax=Legionella birminghamensis TaxID=28083 RepID=A0A378I7F6_9GAMM|nr:XRE family transcriptional regulator [Legionella birminghamensis]KTC76065.1 peptidase, S24 family [Legionella birminghamensis]STX30772.1 peptidase, S24 family [Legionella birminghamensis]